MSEASSPYSKQRRYVRIPSVVPVDYQFLSESGGPVHPDVRTAFTRDLSEAGLCLRVSTLPESAEEALAVTSAPPRITVDLSLPRERLRIGGRVVWVQPATPGTREHLVGIEFQGVEPAQSAALSAFAQQAARRPLLSRGLLLALGVVAVLASGVAYWNHTQRRAELEQADAAVGRATHQYEETARDLQELSANIRSLAAEVDALVAALAPPPDAQERSTTSDSVPTPDDTAAPAVPSESGEEPQLVAPALDELSVSVNRLKSIVAGLREHAEQAQKPQD